MRWSMVMEVIEISNTQGIAKLVERIRAGDGRAEEELVQRYSNGISIIIRKYGGSPALEDLSQETFRLALEKIRRGDVREPERLSGFICGLARNLAIDYQRRAQAQPVTGIESAMQIADPSPSQLDDLLQKEKAQLMRQVLKKLRSRRDRQVLLRFYLTEEDKEEICADLGLTSLQFNQVIHRARERYRTLYQKLVDEM